MKHLFCILIFLAFLGKSTTLYSQGCSDAGVCSVGALGIVKVKMQKLPLVEFKLDLIEIDPSEETATNILKVDSNLAKGKTSKKVKKSRTPGRPKYIFSYTSGYGLGFNRTSIYTQQLEGMYFFNDDCCTSMLNLSSRL